MRPSFKDRPWSAIAMFLGGVALLVCATIRLGDVPFPSRGPSARMNRLWQKDPSSVIVGYCGWVVLVLAAWMACAQQQELDPNDPDDDPIARLDKSDPVPRPPDRDNRTDSH